MRPERGWAELTRKRPQCVLGPCESNDPGAPTASPQERAARICGPARPRGTRSPCHRLRDEISQACSAVTDRREGIEHPLRLDSEVSTGPSSNGRTADFGSVNGGSNPPGPIAFSSRAPRERICITASPRRRCFPSSGPVRTAPTGASGMRPARCGPPPAAPPRCRPSVIPAE
jgi:hypothetical protein